MNDQQLQQLLSEAYDYIENHDAYLADINRLGRMIDRVCEELSSLREYEPDSTLIGKLEDCLNDLEFLKGCAEAAEDMGLTDGDDGRDPDNNWF